MRYGIEIHGDLQEKKMLVHSAALVIPMENLTNPRSTVIPRSSMGKTPVIVAPPVR